MLEQQLFSLFRSTGTISLLYNTFSDLKDMRIDERWNSFMMGVVTSIYVLSKAGLGTLLLNLVVTSIFVGAMAKTKSFGKGDLTTIFWICFGLLRLNWLKFVIFMWLIVLSAFLSNFVQKKAKMKRVPFLPFILVSFYLAVNL